MLTIVLITLLGIALGYVLRRHRWLQRVEMTIMLTIFVMLFVLGLTVGGNEYVVENLPSLGGLAALIALVAMTGSAACIISFSRSEEAAGAMSSVLVLVVFLLGCLAGHYWGDGGVGDSSIYILYALMFQVGISIGCSDNLRQIVRLFRPRMLLIPLSTILGSLLFSALVSFCIAEWGLMDCLAVGSGMGYYSLSSILIAELKADTLGEQLATQLATIALLANILRELAAVTLAPLFRRLFGPFGPIGAAGVTSIDVALPSIARVSGREMIPVALFHGFLIDLSVPFLVPLFC